MKCLRKQGFPFFIAGGFLLYAALLIFIGYFHLAIPGANETFAHDQLQYLSGPWCQLIAILELPEWIVQFDQLFGLLLNGIVCYGSLWLIRRFYRNWLARRKADTCAQVLSFSQLLNQKVAAGYCPDTTQPRDTSDFFPPSPVTVPADLSKPNANYVRGIWLAIGTLSLFLLFYLSLSVWFGWNSLLFLSRGNFIVGGFPLFLAVFMFKALLFVRHRAPEGAIEVTSNDQPRLFDFLHRLADEAGAPRPKRVFLSTRINASVFYDVSIKNLLFPSDKNLEIGLPLVNLLTLSELKAVLAHEFGHFSQRSMAIGSWVYIAQQIAGEMVARRDTQDKVLTRVGRSDIRIAWIAWLLSLVVWSIRSVMDTLFSWVFLAQRGLSRQMEFQADLVAVSLTGSDELVHALYKLPMANESWNHSLGFAGTEWNKNRTAHDIFAAQTLFIDKLGQIIGNESYGHVPPIDRTNPADHRIFRKNFTQPPQMWCTHPANVDREENAKRHYVEGAHDARSPWLLFSDATALKEICLDLLYPVNEPRPSTVSPEITATSIDTSYDVPQYDRRYKGAYIGRSIVRHVAAVSELYNSSAGPGDIAASLAQLYPDHLRDDLSHLHDLNEELTLLRTLRHQAHRGVGGRLVFRGQEISKRQISKAIAEVETEANQVQLQVQEHDYQCRSTHFAAAQSLGHGWAEYWLGLLSVLHFAEHAVAEIQDAHGLLNNTMMIVLADGKVSWWEMKRLIKAVNMLREVIMIVYQQKSEIHLDTSLLAALGISTWGDCFGDFNPPLADKKNMQSWINAVDSFVNAVSGPLSALASRSLVQLLVTEATIARHLQDKNEIPEAPPPTQVLAPYPVLLHGMERKLQTKLGLWDRFLLADGTLASVFRMAVAVAVVGSVIYFGSTKFSLN
jgi:Zn-dependent protease with chaperone function